MTRFDYVKTRREDIRPIKEQHVSAVRFALRWITRLNVAVFRASNGRFMNKFIGGFPACIVTTQGAKTGKIRPIALIHLPHWDNKLLVASQGGMPKNPIWYHNVKAHPDIQIMVGGQERDYHARQVSPQEKARLWPRLVALYPDFDKYQASTDRDIPVFSCSPLPQ